MGKGKPRHNPNKKQNLYGNLCDCCEVIGDHHHCMYGAPERIIETVCKGNRHNCCKVTYRKWAGKDIHKAYPHPESEFIDVSERRYK